MRIRIGLFLMAVLLIFSCSKEHFPFDETKLSSITQNGTFIVEYEYDGDGRLVKESAIILPDKSYLGIIVRVKLKGGLFS